MTSKCASLRDKLLQIVVAASLSLLAAERCSAMTSANFAIPFSTVNAGVGTMASPQFTLVSSIGDGVATATITGSGNMLAAGFINQLYGTVYSCILDVDGNGKIDALTDGLMIIRALFGLTGNSVIANAIGPQATRTTWEAIQQAMHTTALDIDGNGKTDALTDGLLVLRALFGLTGAAVTNGAIGANATRTDWPAIRAYLNASCGTSLAQ